MERTELGRMTWTHRNGATMEITFLRFDYPPAKNKKTEYTMMREMTGADGVLRRGFAEWHRVEGARAEWRSMVERYTRQGWTRTA